jgi:hypothetical protein
VIGDEAMKPVETTKRLEAIKEKVKAKTMVEQAEREERPPLKLLERQILVRPGSTLLFLTYFWFYVYSSNVVASNNVLSNGNVSSKTLFCLTMFRLTTFLSNGMFRLKLN